MTINITSVDCPHCSWRIANCIANDLIWVYWNVCVFSIYKCIWDFWWHRFSFKIFHFLSHLPHAWYRSPSFRLFVCSSVYLSIYIIVCTLEVKFIADKPFEKLYSYPSDHAHQYCKLDLDLCFGRRDTFFRETTFSFRPNKEYVYLA